MDTCLYSNDVTFEWSLSSISHSSRRLFCSQFVWSQHVEHWTANWRHWMKEDNTIFRKSVTCMLFVMHITARRLSVMLYTYLLDPGSMCWCGVWHERSGSSAGWCSLQVNSHYAVAVKYTVTNNIHTCSCTQSQVLGEKVKNGSCYVYWRVQFTEWYCFCEQLAGMKYVLTWCWNNIEI